MSRINERSCNYCGKDYAGRGDLFCSKECQTKSSKGYRTVFLCDVHNEYDKSPHPSLLVAEKFVKDVKPEVIIWGGDIQENASISHHNKQKRLTLENKRYYDDCQSTKDILYRFREHCDVMIYIMGNHEIWVDKYLEEHPEMKGQIDITKDLGLDKLNVVVIPYESHIQIGKINYIHGYYHGKYHAARHFETMGDNVIYGHVHSHQYHTFTRRIDNRPYMSMSVGCLCGKNPEYLEGKPNNWLNGIAIIETRGNLDFNALHLTIIDGQLSYGGQTWKV
jgi:predicted phosphodiesterase